MKLGLLGSNSMKRKSAKEILADSFRELAERKSIAKITVNDVVRNCGYSPSTFYRQFESKYDLIAWSYARDIEEQLDKMNEGDYGWKQIMSDCARYFQEQKRYLTNLLLHTEGLDSFERYMINAHYHNMKKHILTSAKIKKLPANVELTLHVYCMGTARLNCDWLLDKILATTEEIAKTYEDAMPELLRPFFFSK